MKFQTTGGALLWPAPTSRRFPLTLPGDIRGQVSWKNGGSALQNTRRSLNANLPAAGDADNPDRWIPWFRQLADRLARVYILARPWDKVLGSRTLLGDFDNRSVGVFLDPPYRTTSRAPNNALYALDDGDAIFPAVWQWAKEHGDRPNFRIAICGLAGDFDAIPPGWTEYRWRNAGGVGGGGGAGKADEVVLFSPYCVGGNAPAAEQGRLL